MTGTTRVNLRESDYDVYVGRAFHHQGYDLPASIWGNPFVVGRDGTREEVVEQYERYVLTHPELMERLGELEGQRLGCWCRIGDPCHADVLVRLVEERTYQRFPLGSAKPLADAIAKELRHVCSRVEIAGSIRRKKPMVKDIEILARPILMPGQTDLFGTVISELNLLDEYVADKLQHGVWGQRLDVNGRAAVGARYKRLVLNTGFLPGIGIDLFSVLPPAQWGVIQMIRTGPAAFSQRIVTHVSAGGWLPDDLRVKDGAIWRTTSAGALIEIIPTPDEAAVFAVLDRPWITPEERA